MDTSWLDAKYAAPQDLWQVESEPFIRGLVPHLLQRILSTSPSTVAISSQSARSSSSGGNYEAASATANYATTTASDVHTLVKLIHNPTLRNVLWTSTDFPRFFAALVDQAAVAGLHAGPVELGIIGADREELLEQGTTSRTCSNIPTAQLWPLLFCVTYEADLVVDGSSRGCSAPSGGNKSADHGPAADTTSGAARCWREKTHSPQVAVTKLVAAILQSFSSVVVAASPAPTSSTRPSTSKNHQTAQRQSLGILANLLRGDSVVQSFVKAETQQYDEFCSGLHAIVAGRGEKQSNAGGGGGAGGSTSLRGNNYAALSSPARRVADEEMVTQKLFAAQILVSLEGIAQSQHGIFEPLLSSTSQYLAATRQIDGANKPNADPGSFPINLVDATHLALQVVDLPNAHSDCMDGVCVSRFQIARDLLDDLLQVSSNGVDRALASYTIMNAEVGRATTTTSPIGLGMLRKKDSLQMELELRLANNLGSSPQRVEGESSFNYLNSDKNFSVDYHLALFEQLHTFQNTDHVLQAILSLLEKVLVEKSAHFRQNVVKMLSEQECKSTTGGANKNRHASLLAELATRQHPGVSKAAARLLYLTLFDTNRVALTESALRPLLLFLSRQALQNEETCGLLKLMVQKRVTPYALAVCRDQYQLLLQNANRVLEKKPTNTNLFFNLLQLGLAIDDALAKERCDRATTVHDIMKHEPGVSAGAGAGGHDQVPLVGSNSYATPGSGATVADSEQFLASPQAQQRSKHSAAPSSSSSSAAYAGIANYTPDQHLMLLNTNSATKSTTHSVFHQNQDSTLLETSAACSHATTPSCTSRNRTLPAAKTTSKVVLPYTKPAFYEMLESTECVSFLIYDIFAHTTDQVLLRDCWQFLRLLAEPSCCLPEQVKSAVVDAMMRRNAEAEKNRLLVNAKVDKEIVFNLNQKLEAAALEREKLLQEAARKDTTLKQLTESIRTCARDIAKHGETLGELGRARERIANLEEVVVEKEQEKDVARIAEADARVLCQKLEFHAEREVRQATERLEEHVREKAELWKLLADLEEKIKAAQVDRQLLVKQLDVVMQENQHLRMGYDNFDPGKVALKGTFSPREEPPVSLFGGYHQFGGTTSMISPKSRRTNGANNSTKPATFATGGNNSNSNYKTSSKSGGSGRGSVKNIANNSSKPRGNHLFFPEDGTRKTKDSGRSFAGVRGSSTSRDEMNFQAGSSHLPRYADQMWNKNP
ncbi:unnamed protein product [Amoebophrya sp. A120]|nr:unnamed protein product [Amoebophrya sp. A120]|eukprot:GSA120T00024914001.1